MTRIHSQAEMKWSFSATSPSKLFFLLFNVKCGDGLAAANWHKKCVLSCSWQGCGSSCPCSMIIDSTCFTPFPWMKAEEERDSLVQQLKNQEHGDGGAGLCLSSATTNPPCILVVKRLFLIVPLKVWMKVWSTVEWSTFYFWETIHTGMALSSKWYNLRLSEIARLYPCLKLLLGMDFECFTILYPWYNMIMPCYLHVAQENMELVGKGEFHVVESKNVNKCDVIVRRTAVMRRRRLVFLLGILIDEGQATDLVARRKSITRIKLD